MPFVGALTTFVLGFVGLAYSFLPVCGAGSADDLSGGQRAESLMIILVGALFVLPVIIAYSAFAYWVFRGKASALKYE